MPALERPADVAVGRKRAPGAVSVTEPHVADWKAQLVQPPEYLCERSRDVSVHDELALVHPAVEAEVRHGEEP